MILSRNLNKGASTCHVVIEVEVGHEMTMIEHEGGVYYWVVYTYEVVLCFVFCENSPFEQLHYKSLE